jgi:hypothetical protein
LAKFEREREERLGLLERQIDRLEKRIDESRRRAARRAQWGDRADSPDVPEDVVEQFQKTWTRSERPSRSFIKKEVNETTKEELKTLYRRLAKRFHPDLVRDPAEKHWREEQMAKVNTAYADQDMTALLAIEGNAVWTPVKPVQSREEEIVELRSELKRLNGLIAELERTLRELINSDVVKLMLDVSIARKSGRDLLREMETALLARVATLQSELSSIA